MHEERNEPPFLQKMLFVSKMRIWEIQKVNETNELPPQVRI